LVYFRTDVVELAQAGWTSIKNRAVRTHHERLAWLLLLSAIPGAIIGAFGEKVIEDKLGKPWLIGVMLIVFGLVLYLADRLPGSKEPDDYGVPDAILLGAAQMLALQPGVSRSGITMTAGRYRGFTRDAAARLSFLMALPITGGAVLYKGAKLAANGGLASNLVPPFVWGTIVSALSGYIAVVFLLRLIRTRTFAPFVVYRVLAGAAVIIIAATSWR
jgi:undecaprenyl-diphosphatase